MVKRIVVALFFATSLYFFSCSTSSSPQHDDVESNKSEIAVIDGNTYNIVKIGDQWWTTKNLNVTRYRNGDTIPNIKLDSVWFNLTADAWCDYNNNDASSLIYGKLYNWYAVSDPRGIAPEGWHIPTDSGWKVLEMFLGINFNDLDQWDLRGVDEGDRLNSLVLVRYPASYILS